MVTIIGWALESRSNARGISRTHANPIYLPEAAITAGGGRGRWGLGWGSDGQMLEFWISGWWRWSRPAVVMATTMEVVELGFGFPGSSSVHRTTKGEGVWGPLEDRCGVAGSGGEVAW
jgi:hypothetical protein